MAFEFFRSHGEAKHYALLLLLESRGKISNLEKQVKFPLHTRGPDGLITQVTTYICDFVYDDKDGKRVLNEFKGGMTPVSALKMKWLKAEYGLTPIYSKGK